MSQTATKTIWNIADALGAITFLSSNFEVRFRTDPIRFEGAGEAIEIPFNSISYLDSHYYHMGLLRLGVLITFPKQEDFEKFKHDIHSLEMKGAVSVAIPIYQNKFILESTRPTYGEFWQIQLTLEEKEG